MNQTRTLNMRDNSNSVGITWTTKRPDQNNLKEDSQIETKAKYRTSFRTKSRCRNESNVKSSGKKGGACGSHAEKCMLELWDVRAGGKFHRVVLGQTKYRQHRRGKTTRVVVMTTLRHRGWYGSDTVLNFWKFGGGTMTTWWFMEDGMALVPCWNMSFRWKKDFFWIKIEKRLKYAYYW